MQTFPTFVFVWSIFVKSLSIKYYLKNDTGKLIPEYVLVILLVSRNYALKIITNFIAVWKWSTPKKRLRAEFMSEMYKMRWMVLKLELHSEWQQVLQEMC